jgi:hypothetical protein
VANRFSALPIRRAADGSVSFDFDGHVYARGLDLLLGVSVTPPQDRRVRWLSEATYLDDDPDVGGEAYAYDVGSSRILALAAHPPADGVAGELPAELWVQRDQAAAEGGLFFDPPDEEVGIDIVRRDGAASYGAVSTHFVLRKDTVQLGESARTGIDLGKTTITGNGAATRTKDVAHTLGVTPKIVLATTEAGTSASFFATAMPLSATQVRLGVTARDGTFNTTETIYWLALA